jgi:hypothetical protein
MPDAGNAKILPKRLKTQKPLQNCTGGQQLAQDRKMAAAMGRVCAEVACGVWRVACMVAVAKRARTHRASPTSPSRIEVIPDSGSHTKKKKRTNGVRETT